MLRLTCAMLLLSGTLAAGEPADDYPSFAGFNGAMAGAATTNLNWQA